MKGRSGFTVAIVGCFALGVAFAGWLLKGAVEATARRALEVVASDMAGTPATMGALRFDFSVLAGGKIGLRIIKPDGFAGADAFKFDQVTIELDPIEVLADPTVIDLMIIEAPHISYTAASVAQSPSAQSSSAQSSSANDSAWKTQAPSRGLRARDFVIERLLLRDGFLLIAAPGFDRPLRVAMPDLDLRDIDGEENKATPGEAIAQIVRLALADARQEASESELAAMADDIGAALGDLGTYLGEELKALGKALGSAAKETNKALEEFLKDDDQD